MTTPQPSTDAAVKSGRPSALEAFCILWCLFFFGLYMWQFREMVPHILALFFS